MATYIVDVAKLRLGKDKEFAKGDTIDISDDLATKLLKKAYITFDKTPKKVISVGNSISEMTADEAKKMVDSIDSIEELERLLKEETSGKKRKTLITAIEERIVEVEEAQKEDIGEGENEDINTKFNPDDMIVK
jgi:hypothetical protein